MRSNGYYFGEEMGKEGRYKKEAKEVDIWNIGVRGAISVSRSPFC